MARLSHNSSSFTLECIALFNRSFRIARQKVVRRQFQRVESTIERLHERETWDIQSVSSEFFTDTFFVGNLGVTRIRRLKSVITGDNECARVLARRFRREFNRSDTTSRTCHSTFDRESNTTKCSPLAGAGCYCSPVPPSRAAPALSEYMRGDSPSRRRLLPVSCDRNGILSTLHILRLVGG